MDLSPIKEEDNCNFFTITPSDGDIKNENEESHHSNFNLIMFDIIKTESPDPLMIETDTINMEANIFEPEISCDVSLKVVTDSTFNEANVINAIETVTEAINISSHLKPKYACLHCPMAFTSKKVLRKHNSIHNEKCEKYQCDLCGRLFQHNSNLICHKKIHMTVDGNVVNGKREFTNDERNVILQFLLDRKINGQLPKGSLGEAAKKFDCNRITISRIWKLACEGFANGDTCPSVDSLKKHCGRKRIDYSDKLTELSKIPKTEGVSLNSLSRTLSIPKTTLYNIYQRGEIKRKSGDFKPNLSEENKRERSEFCLSKLLPNRHFEELYDYVHVDEKCYYLTKLNKSYYLSLDKEGPQILSERNFVTEVVIIAAVARPRYYDTKHLFDGKVGIWTFVTQELVHRKRSIRSERKMREKLKKNHIESVNRDDIRKIVLQKLYRSIYEKWPNGARALPIYVQLDESKSHLSPFDANVVEEGLRNGWNISLKPQPPNSSDFNALDKGFFNSLQQLESKTYWKAPEDLVSEIENAFNDEPPNSLENAFLGLRKGMDCSLNDNGSNNFNLEEMEVSFKCDDANKALEQKPNLDVHMQDTIGTLNIGEDKKATIENKFQDNLIQGAIPKTSKYSCRTCSRSQTIMNKPNWPKHKNANGENNCQCDINQCDACGKAFQKNSHLLSHKKMHTTANGNIASGKREFTNDERNAILQFLLDRKINGKLPKGSFVAAAEKFECNRMTVSRIWKRACEGFADGNSNPCVDSLKKQCGRKRIDYSDKLSKIPQNESVSLKSLSRTLSIPRTTLYNIYRRGEIKRESGDVQPTLSEENTRERFEFCTSKLHSDRLLEELYDYVHVDEKCYYLTKLNKSYYLSLDGKGPEILSERNFVTKVVIIAAVARPRYDEFKNNLFDGKIGIWTFVSQELVQRNRSIRSERKMKGKMKNKSIVSLNRDDIRIAVSQKLYRSICEKWPNESKTMPVYVQLDESKHNLSIFDSNIAEHCLRSGCNIQLKPQPKNSPDFNSLHQGFFNSMHSLESKKYWKSVDELVTEIERVFNLESPDLIDNAFSSVRTAMENSLVVTRSKYDLQEMEVEQIYPNFEIL